YAEPSAQHFRWAADLLSRYHLHAMITMRFLSIISLGVLAAASSLVGAAERPAELQTKLEAAMVAGDALVKAYDAALASAGDNSGKVAELEAQVAELKAQLVAEVGARIAAEHE